MLGRRRTRRALAAALAAASLAGACADNAAPDVRQTDATARPITTAAETSVPTSRSSGSDDADHEADVPSDDATDDPQDGTAATVAPADLLTVVQDAPEHDGWAVPPGTWRSTAFEPALAFETSRELRLVDQEPEAIRFALPDAAPDARITVFVPLAAGSDDVTPTAPSDDLAASLEARESVELTRVVRDRTHAGDEYQWADFSSRRAPGFRTYLCDLGDECIWIMRTVSNANVDVIEHAPIRLASLRVGDTPVRVLATAVAEADFERVGEQALAIARSLREVMPGDGTPVRTFLSMVGTRGSSIPAGTHATFIDGTVVDLRLDEPLEHTTLAGQYPQTIALDVGELGTLFVFRPIGLVDPDAPQAPLEEIGRDALLEPGSIDVATWFERMYTDVTSSSTTVAGSPATRLSGTPNTDDSWPCGDLARTDARCITIGASAVGWWYAADEPPYGAMFHVHDHDLFVASNPDPGVDLAEFDAAVGEILSRLVVNAPPLLERVVVESDTAGSVRPAPGSSAATVVVRRAPLRWI